MQDITNPTQPQRKMKPDWLPPKFWNDEAGEIMAEELARSYIELERVRGDGFPAELGAVPERYTLTIDDDLLDEDEEVNELLRQNGFTNAQAQLVYDLAGRKVLPLVSELAAQYENAREAERLNEHFGGRERFDAIRPQLRAWAQANLPASIYRNLVASADGVIAMHKMMQSGEPGLMPGANPVAGVNEDDLKQMMRDKRYWKDRDPVMVQKVRDGFKALYPEEG
ncbi:MAG: hypothetical protein HQL36_01310 [Alphaproteobacteria bacterium]|nr:hypothetical protein [Alphaproteobacteria bacterium]MBF0249879.1 hypothetical protein [Alphaproteobacteria bacterium]